MKKFAKIMLALVLVAGALFTNVSNFVGADTAITAEAASNKNPRLHHVSGKIAWVRFAPGHKMTRVSVNNKTATIYPEEMTWLDDDLGHAYGIYINKGSNRVEVHDDKGYWAVFYVNR